jgi:hypothetical protein
MSATLQATLRLDTLKYISTGYLVVLSESLIKETTWLSKFLLPPRH